MSTAYERLSMCYPKPGPRCYSHALKDYVKIRESGDPVKTAEALGELERTPTVIALLQRKGEFGRADRAQAERDIQLEMLRAERERTPLFGELRKLKQASDPLSSEEDLERLSRDENPLVRQAVAANPLTSPETLQHLLIDPEKDGQVDGALINEILGNHNASPELLGRFVDVGFDPTTHHSLVMENPNFDDKSINVALDTTSGHYIPSILAGHESNTSQTLARIYGTLSEPSDYGDGISPNTRLKAIEDLAKHPKLSVEIRADILEKHGDEPNVMSSLASNPSLTSLEVKHLVERHERNPFQMGGEREGLLRNPSVDHGTIARLTSPQVDNDGGIANYSSGELQALSVNPYVEKTLLRRVSQDVPEMRQYVASNPSWSADELRSMNWETSGTGSQGDFTDSGLATGLMKNPHTPSDIVDSLSRSGDYEVAHQVASSPLITPTAAENLLRSHRGTSGVQSTVLRNPATSPTILEKRFKSSALSYEDLKSIASNPSTPQAVLKRIFKDIAASPDPRQHIELTHALTSNSGVPRYWGLALTHLSGKK